MPDESRALAIVQLQTMSGVAKGLTRANDVFDLEDDSDEDPLIMRAREEPRMLQLREQMLEAVKATINLWSTDAGIGDVCGAFK